MQREVKLEVVVRTNVEDGESSEETQERVADQITDWLRDGEFPASIIPEDVWDVVDRPKFPVENDEDFIQAERK